MSTQPHAPRSTKHTTRHRRPTHPDRYERGTRSYTMSHIRGKDTTIEVLVRKYLFARGLRFRKNDKRYPGHPDVVLPKWRTIVFINGCFWHGHLSCPLFTLPKSNVSFWQNKIERNINRDRENTILLEQSGWRVITVWECEIRNGKDSRTRLDDLYLEITTGSTP